MTRRIETEVTIVGAGPAGLAAAAVAARAGARVVVLDAFAEPGGQYMMQPRAGLGGLAAAPQAAAGRAARDAALAAGAEILCRTEVFWARRRDGGFDLYAAAADGAVHVAARTLIVASGAHDRVVPFEGWTLPGVVTAGAAQRLVKSGGVPGRRTLLAGNGVFLLAVAATFGKAGLPLAGIVDAGRPSLRHLAALARFPGRLGEAVDLLTSARAAGARVRRGMAVVAARGATRVEAAEVAPLGADGIPDLGRAETIEGIDALAVSHGLRPVIELTALLGAEHAHDPALGGWHCRAEAATGATSVPDLFAAGETTGFAGARPAVLSGRLAGAAAAERLGLAAAHLLDRAATLEALRRARAFARALADLWPQPAGLGTVIPRDVVICRCEDVTRGEIEAALDDGARDAFGAKMWTRAGMGPCQGKICGDALAAIVAGRLGTALPAAGFNRPHLPLRPVPLRIVAEALGSP